LCHQHHNQTYSESGELEPDNEGSLHGEIPGEVVEDHSESEGLNEVEETEHDPVGEPLNVVLRRRGLDRLEGEISGEEPANEVGHGLGERVEGKKESGEGNDTNDSVGFRDLCLLLEAVQNRVLGELNGMINRRCRIRSE